MNRAVPGRGTAGPSDVDLDLLVRHPTADDHPRVLAVMDEWWDGLGGTEGSVQRALLLPRLFFQHFSDSSYLAERPDSSLVAFLVGLLSPARPDVAYIHFVGVDPGVRRTGVAAGLYHRFFRMAVGRGARLAQCITSPANTRSVAFHASLGFVVDPSETTIDGLPVHRDYDGPGLDRVTLTRRLG